LQSEFINDTMKEELQKAREDYQQDVLNVSDVNKDPLKQFKLWFKEYQGINKKDFNAMVLSTATNNQPSSRVVLLKGIDKGGFEFYTNYNSNKAGDIERNPKVSLNFYWPELERQVRVEGKAVKLTGEESDQYFAIRPRGSKLGAWASPQSHEISREKLIDNLKAYEDKFRDEVPRPDNWGGYRVLPVRFEFWQGRSNRLHDRICYSLESGTVWKIKRLAP